MSSKKKNSYRSKTLTVAFFNIDYMHVMGVTNDCIIVMKSGNKKVIEDPKEFEEISICFDEWCDSKDEGNKDE
jgi:hypothetical protein